MAFNSTKSGLTVRGELFNTLGALTKAIPELTLCKDGQFHEEDSNFHTVQRTIVFGPPTN